MDHAGTDEQARLSNLRTYAILDTPPEVAFDRLTRLLAHICETPIATVTLVDERRQWVKSSVGLDMGGTGRAMSMCALTMHAGKLLVVPDTFADPMLAANPPLAIEPGIRFYAGVPLVSPNGFGLGAMAVMDRVPRVLRDDQLEALETLGAQVMTLLELQRHRLLCDVAPHDPAMQQAVAAQTALEADLRQGLQNNEFLLYYQPQVGRDGKPIGAEALVRWRHPRRGLVSPGEFIPLAEKTGLVVPLGQWVLESACRQLAAWAQRAGTAALTLSVNVSARQLRQADFIEQVQAVLARTGADPCRLKLELTEGSLIDDVEATIAKMKALKARGVGFSLDDFGTGYSSLAYLKRLPLDQLKIDSSFVRDMLDDSNHATIARTIVSLGQSLGLAVIAEGVETQAQRDFLASNNCDAYQGYLFSRPLPADQFDAFVTAAAAKVPAGESARPGMKFAEWLLQ